MMEKTKRELLLEQRIVALEKELDELKKNKFTASLDNAVKVPPALKAVFDKAQLTVAAYFKNLKIDPSQASIEVGGQRYLLMRAASLSIGFYNTLVKLYPDKDEVEILRLASNFLFDIAHVIGMEDAKVFHKTMEVSDPIAKLSAGPVHFAFSGWAYVEIDPESNPVANDDFFLKYSHPYSFEADSWIKEGKSALGPVCFMNSGYSSGWCEQSFGIKLTAVELTCKACGDDTCSFIMAPPHRINEYLQAQGKSKQSLLEDSYHIPTFFKRKELEDEMRLAKIRAEESDKAKSEFLANMSHEMRTPLNAIQGYVALLLKEPQSKKNTLYLDIIANSSNHLMKLVDDILDLSKIEARQLVVVKESFSLGLLINSCQHTAVQFLNKLQRNIELTFDIDEGISDFISSDAVRLKQVLDNLITNAIKFTQAGHINLSVQLTGQSKILFAVKDTGIGVTPEMQKTIFNMFDQVDASQTRQYGGAGLGLNISKKIVNLLEGEMWVESSIGVGSTFYFDIPYNPVIGADKNEVVVQKVLPDVGKGKLILLVEDNMFNHQMIGIILESHGFKVHKCYNGKEAVNFFLQVDRSHIDLIIMDVQMPIMDGLTATKLIRSEEKKLAKDAVTIVALTASAMQSDRKQCLAVGCNYFLTKPISPDDFIGAIVSYL